ncbi:phosphoenolpyruvate carboxykinase (ATP) [Kineococcus sp. SYSU DK003]|uniref:hypothetical protein n=1 Tax=Kineococcus sp. SYSU DK003 TaxID=3383124 RepID=UPI003D7D5A10
MTPAATVPPVAYGLALPDLTGARRLLRTAGGHETTWRIERIVAPADDEVPTAADRARAVLPMTRGRVDIDRARATTTFRAVSPPADDEVVHPYLAATAATVAWWRGQVALHAGAVLVDGRVWAVLGERGAGKSTAMYSLVRAGLPLVTDDVLVLDGSRVLPGPRCIDLRRPTAEHYGVGQDIGVVGRRQRFRVEVDDQLDAGAELELAGLVHLAWGEQTGVDDVPLPARWPALVEALALKLPPADQNAVLALLTLPTYRFRRPRRFEEVDRAAHVLAATLSARGVQGLPGPATPAAAG